MFTLAGNTATNSATSPHPARRFVRSNANPAPSAISHAPLSHTSASGQGSALGMMRTKGSGLTKCRAPTATIASEMAARASLRAGEIIGPTG